MSTLTTSTASMVRRAARAAALPLAAGGVIGLAAPAVAGLGDPGGSVHIWAGGFNDNWHVGSNWNVGFVPEDDDSVLILDAFTNIHLDADSANLGSLYHAANRTLSTNGHRLNVASGAGAATTITGVDSRIFVGPDTAGWDFTTDVLEVENDARLQMGGGDALIHDQLTAASDARIQGHGRVRVDSPNPAAFNAFNALAVNVSGGDLELEVVNGGSIAPPPLLQVLQSNRTLTIDAPFFTPVQDVLLGDGCELTCTNPWTLDGQLEVQAGGGGATVSGADLAVNGHIEIDGQLVMSPSVVFGPTATTNIDGELRITGDVVSPTGHTTALGLNDRLRLDAQAVWQGDIDSSAGIIESNAPSGVFDLEGDVLLGSIFGVRTRFEGTAAVRAHGVLTANGFGGAADAEFQLMPTGVLDLVQPTSQFILNAAGRFHQTADLMGDGQLTIGATGAAYFGPFADIDVDVYNTGDMNAGLEDQQTGYTYVNGDFTQSESGRLVVELGGLAPDQRDVYEVTGVATLDGQIHVELVGGFQPTPGDAFDTLWANAGFVGAFDAVTGEPGFEATFSGNQLTLTYVGVTPPCPADLNDDGVIDSADLNLVLLHFGVTNEGDVDGDGDTDSVDLNLLLADFGEVC